MSKIRRGGHVLFCWKGDHGPRHVHVYRGGRLVLKWDLEHNKAMKGWPSGRVLAVIKELQSEGRI